MKFTRIRIIKRKRDLILRGNSYFIINKKLFFIFRNGNTNEGNKKQMDEKIIKLYKKNSDNIPVGGDANVKIKK